MDAAFRGAMVSSSQWLVSAAPGPLTSCIIAFRLWTSASDRRRGAAAPGSGSESEARGGVVGWDSAVMVWPGEGDGKKGEERGGRDERGGALGGRWVWKVRGFRGLVWPLTSLARSEACLTRLVNPGDETALCGLLSAHVTVCGDAGQPRAERVQLSQA